MISREEFAQVARLAGLDLSVEEQERLVRDLTTILDYVARLDELDLGVSPAVSHDTERTTPLRADRVAPQKSRTDALVPVPTTATGFIRVPKVLT
jgi:aspartyl-tRNA(Asn)/glutamyl-tRNA(Gln) amidotransferase subunit C